MKLPSPVTPGQPLSARAFNDLLAYVRSIELRGGPGVLVQRSAVGTTVSATAKPGTGQPIAITHPFQVSNASTATAARVSVRKGSVNDVVPTGISPNELTCTSAGTWRIYLDCTISDDAAGTVTAAAIAVTSGAQPANTRTHAYVTIATATVAAVTGGFNVSAVDQLATHSLRFYACGRDASSDGTYQFWGI